MPRESTVVQSRAFESEFGRRWTPLSACLALLLYVAAVPLAFAAEPIRYGEAYSAMQSIYSLPILVAQREGFFVQEGLDFEIVMIPGGGGNMIKALDDGTVDLAHVATPYLIDGVLAGSDAAAIASEFANPIYSLVAKPNITNLSELRGRVIGLADQDSTINYSIWKLLGSAGLRKSDVNLRTISGTPERLNCLEDGACDAVALGQPEDFTAVAKAFHRIGYSDEATPSFVYTVTAARRSWAEQHKDEVLSYLRALARALHYIRDPSHRDELVRIIAATESGSEKDARATLELYFDPERHVLPVSGEIDLAGLREVVSFLSTRRPIEISQTDRFVDLHFLQALGFQ
jgi:ABC-type nitrate/sulfonate/bicarbonate transport system substrate-binding protein